MATGVKPRERISGVVFRSLDAWQTRPALAATFAFFVAMAIAGTVAAFVTQEWQLSAEQRFARRASSLQFTLTQALNENEALLRGARAFLAQRPDPDYAQWQRFVSSFDLDTSHSAVSALGYLPPQLEAGPDKAHPPASPGPLWAGTNLHTPGNPSGDTTETRDAREHAARTGSVALAVIENPNGPAPSLLLYLPYVEDSPRTEPANYQATGFTVARLDAGKLLDPLAAAQRDLTVTVRAGKPERVLYQSTDIEHGEFLPSARFRREDTLLFGGTTLTLDVSADGSPLLTGAAACAAAILLAGLLAAGVCAGLVFRLARARIAETSSRLPFEETQLGEARMMGIIRSSMEAIITVDESQRVVIFNPAAEAVFGLTAMEAIGAPLSRFIPERFRASHAQHVEQFGVTRVSERQMGHRQRVLSGLRANGDEFPIEASISQIHDQSGKLYTVMLRDITERLRAEQALEHSREELRELSANLQTVREAEKTRIARELHDDLGQQLTALKIDISTLEHNLSPPVRSDVAARLAGMRRLIDSTVAAVRRIAADLRPVMLDDLGLVPAIEWLANDFTNRYGIEIVRRIDTAGAQFSGHAASSLFRIVQEALTNVARHAEATHVVLSLMVHDSSCNLRICDDGLGANPSDQSRHTPHDKSFGLLGIRERAHMLGGIVTIDTAPDEGFAIAIKFPIGTLLSGRDDTHDQGDSR